MVEVEYVMTMFLHRGDVAAANAHHHFGGDGVDAVGAHDHLVFRAANAHLLDWEAAQLYHGFRFVHAHHLVDAHHLGDGILLHLEVGADPIYFRFRVSYVHSGGINFQDFLGACIMDAQRDVEGAAEGDGGVAM